MRTLKAPWVSLIALLAVVIGYSKAVGAATTTYDFNISTGGSGSFVYDDVNLTATAITLDFGALGSSVGNFSSTTTFNAFGTPPGAHTKSSNGTYFPLHGGTASSVRFYSDGHFCVNPVGETCVLRGGYSMAPQVPPQTYSGVYSFGFSTAGSGTFRYDAVAGDIDQLQYDFGSFGRGATSFGSQLTANVFGNPPSSAVIQNNTFFGLQGEGSAYGFRLRDDGTFCIRPDAGVCASDDLVSGTYWISRIEEGAVPIGDNVVSVPEVVDESGDPVANAPDITLSFDAIEEGGDTTVTVLTEISPEEPPIPAAFTLQGTTTYLDIQTTAEFAGDIEVCINYQSNVDESLLRLLHLHDGVWSDITAPGYPDTSNNILCGTTDSFSIFREALLIPPDADGDGVLDISDNCVDDANPGQEDNDNDQVGDACDADDDNDTVDDVNDNCQFTPNVDQNDLDGDGDGDACDGDLDGDAVANDADNCPQVPNEFQDDSDLDEIGDACDADDDNDTVEDGADNCQFTANVNQNNLDGDEFGDACDADVDGDGVDNEADNCPVDNNPLQDNTDLDEFGNTCDPDDDNDGRGDAEDNCPLTVNPDQNNLDGDDLGDVCDPDDDNDGSPDESDNCPIAANPTQANNDGDLAGDACDPDDDNDSVLDDLDNCPFSSNPGQSDVDGDGRGDVCDDDLDGDTVLNGVDNCPVDPNGDQADMDVDGLGDACDPDIDGDTQDNDVDNCPYISNTDQADLEGDGLGDVCDADDDNDGILDGSDNCPAVSNDTQADFDGDAVGDACDPDVDGDGVDSIVDLCAATPVGDLVDPGTGCSLAQLCPCEGPRGTTESWRNHGKYVSCMSQTVGSFVEAGLLSEANGEVAVSNAAKSSCGDKK